MNDLFKKIQPFLHYLIALIGGGLLPYSFAPYGYGVFGFISPAIFLWCISKESVKKAFFVGLMYGIGLFGIGANWVYVSIHDYGYASPLLAGGLTSLFVAALALFPACLAATLNRFFPQNNNIRCLLAFPVLWVLFEMLRGWLFTGFPWLYVGYSQIQSHLNAFAPIGSVFAVSWVCAFVAGLFYAIYDYFYEDKENPRSRNILFLTLFLVWGVAYGLSRITWTYPSQNKLNVALVQGNIPQETKWQSDQVAHIIEVYENLTKQALIAEPKVDLIIWPEGAIPMSAQSAASLLEQLDLTLDAEKTGLILGIPWVTPRGQFYNAMIGFGWKTDGVYHKKHLVPFGEYVPFESVLRGLIKFFDLPMSSFISGPDNQPLMLSSGFKIAPAICYEIAFPTLVRSVSKNADFILTLSNDTWFGTSIGPAQHLEIAMFRALETQKPVVRVTNSGFTAIINPEGEIQEIANQFEATVLYGTVTQMIGQTFWVRFGIWPLMACLVGTLGLAFLFNKKIK